MTFISQGHAWRAGLNCVESLSFDVTGRVTSKDIARSLMAVLIKHPNNISGTLNHTSLFLQLAQPESSYMLRNELPLEKKVLCSIWTLERANKSSRCFCRMFGKPSGSNSAVVLVFEDTRRTQSKMWWAACHAFNSHEVLPKDPRKL